MVDVAYIISHGFAARMIIQTDLAGKLREKGKSVAFIVPDKKDKVLSSYCNRRGIQLFEFAIRSNFFDENYMFKRKYFLEDIQHNPALHEKHIYSTRYHLSLHPIRLFRPYFYFLIYKLIPYLPFIRSSFTQNEKRHLISPRAEELINRLKPRKLISTYPVNFSEAVLLYYGNMQPEIETWIHLLSWDNITCKGRFPQTANKYIVWGSIMKAELEEHYGVIEDAIFPCGVPHFDVHVSVKQNPDYKPVLASLGLNPQHPYVLFAMSSPRFAPYEIDIVEWLAKKVSEGGYGKLQLIIRPHPQNVKGNMADKSWLPRLRKLSSVSSVAVDFPELVESKMNYSMELSDMVRFSRLLSGSSLVINSGSTVSIDALIHDKPVILSSFDAEKNVSYWRSAKRLVDYPHLKKLCDSKGVIVSRSFEHLNGCILNLLTSPTEQVIKGRRALMCQLADIDGNATNNVVSVLCES